MEIKPYLAGIFPKDYGIDGHHHRSTLIAKRDDIDVALVAAESSYILKMFFVPLFPMEENNRLLQMVQICTPKLRVIEAR